MKMLITAYCACHLCCGGWAKQGLTSSGRAPVEGRTIAGPRGWPIGTSVTISGVGRRIVEDRMARRVDDGQTIDLYFDDHRQAQRWGRRWRTVVID